MCMQISVKPLNNYLQMYKIVQNPMNFGIKSNAQKFKQFPQNEDNKIKRRNRNNNWLSNSLKFILTGGLGNKTIKLIINKKK